MHESGIIIPLGLFCKNLKDVRVEVFPLTARFLREGEYILNFFTYLLPSWNDIAVIPKTFIWKFFAFLAKTGIVSDGLKSLLFFIRGR